METQAVKQSIKSQYGASLGMLREAVDRCSEELWLDSAYKHPFWRVAYHTLFFADLYFSSSVDAYTPWAKHIDELQALGPMVFRGGKLPKEGPAYSKGDIQEFCALVMGKVDAVVDAVVWDAPSGFPWLPFSKLELQVYNIRHIQHHAGQLVERLRQNLDVGVDWIMAK